MKYVFSLCSLAFYPLNRIFCRKNVLYFDGFWVTKFSFDVRSKNSLHSCRSQIFYFIFPVSVLSLFIHQVVSDSFVTLWTVACQAPLSMGFPRQEYWSGLPFPSAGDLPDPGWTLHLYTGRQILYHWATREAQKLYSFMFYMEVHA